MCDDARSRREVRSRFGGSSPGLCASRTAAPAAQSHWSAPPRHAVAPLARAAECGWSRQRAARSRVAHAAATIGREGVEATCGAGARCRVPRPRSCTVRQPAVAPRWLAPRARSDGPVGRRGAGCRDAQGRHHRGGARVAGAARREDGRQRAAGDADGGAQHDRTRSRHLPRRLRLRHACLAALRHHSRLGLSAHRSDHRPVRAAATSIHQHPPAAPAPAPAPAPAHNHLSLFPPPTTISATASTSLQTPRRTWSSETLASSLCWLQAPSASAAWQDSAPSARLGWLRMPRPRQTSPAPALAPLPGLPALCRGSQPLSG